VATQNIRQQTHNWQNRLETCDPSHYVTGDIPCANVEKISRENTRQLRWLYAHDAMQWLRLRIDVKVTDASDILTPRTKLGTVVRERPELLRAALILVRRFN